jgi:hypothetical protein
LRWDKGKALNTITRISRRNTRRSQTPGKVSLAAVKDRYNHPRSTL